MIILKIIIRVIYLKKTINSISCTVFLWFIIFLAGLHCTKMVFEINNED